MRCTAGIRPIALRIRTASRCVADPNQQEPAYAMDVTVSATANPPLPGAAELIIGGHDTIESLNPAAEALFGYPAAELRGRSIKDLIVPRPGLAPGPGAAALPELVPDGHLILGRHRSGAVFPLFASSRHGDDGAHLRLERPVSGTGGAARAEHPGATRHHLLILNALLRPAANGAPLRTQLESALDLILSLPGLPAGTGSSIQLLDADGRLTLQVTCKSRLPAGECHDCEIPIVNGERLLGILTLSMPRSAGIVCAEAEFLWLIAETLAALIERMRAEDENLRLLDENRRLNRRLVGILEEERRRLARELHDDVGQSLTAIKADAALIVNRCGSADSPVHRSATAISATADHLYNVTHALIRQLRPGALDDLGIVAAVQSHVQAWRERRPGMACTFGTEGEFDGLGEEINITLYRVVQESLTNVIRHAAASRVEVRLTRARNAAGADEVCVVVGDDGRGVEQQQLHARQRFGLLGIRERVESLGGRLTLDSRPGQGFRLSACLPVPVPDRRGG